VTAVLQAGAVIAERYRVDRLLGRGGMGEVYAVHDGSLGETIALKTLGQTNAMSPAAVIRFQREVRLSRKVTSPHVTRCYDIGTSADGVHYLTMELVDGESLLDRLRRVGGLDAAELRRIGMGMCEGLLAAHEAGVLHRDLKPANVLLDDPRVLLTDFGIARAIDPTPQDGIETVGFIGTPRYAAPEVFERGAFSVRSDLFSLGVVLCEASTGRSFRRCEGDATTPSPPLTRLLTAMLAHRPEQRPDSLQQVMDALGELPSAAPSRDEPTVCVARGAAAAPIPSLSPRLAIVPLSARGRDAEEVAIVVGEELVDLLSHGEQLQVVAHRGDDDRDATITGRRLGADWVLHGSVLREGARVRIQVRINDVATGTQSYSGRFDAEMTDLFELQDRIARRIAEALRVEIAVVARRGQTDPEAMASYISGRKKLLSAVTSATESFTDLQDAVTRAPDFDVAHAALAVSAVRVWFFANARAEGQQVAAQARAAVAQALERAPNIAESHLAAGMLAAQLGDYPAAADALSRALAIAPTCAAAHEYLGILECEAGRGRDGVRRVELAHALDPGLTGGMVSAARWHALAGDAERAVAILQALRATVGTGIARAVAELRIGVWTGDGDAVRRALAELPTERIPELSRMALYGRVALGLASVEDVELASDSLVNNASNPRFATLCCQISAESLAFAGELDRALVYLLRAEQFALVDVDWLERCPLLEALRGRPEFVELTERVRRRASAIWTVT
jgi:eukaryotic-like serine/threonine-protein kinase